MRFESVHHPGEASRPWLVLRAQARPVAIALLTVMTVGLAAALQGRNILWPFVGAAGVAYALAVFVGQGSLTKTPAAVEFRGPFAAVQTVWDAATDPPDTRLEPVVSARLAYGELSVGLGDAIVTFQRADWPEFDGLVDAFRASAREGEALLWASSRPLTS